MLKCRHSFQDKTSCTFELLTTSFSDILKIKIKGVLLRTRWKLHWFCFNSNYIRRYWMLFEATKMENHTLKTSYLRFSSYVIVISANFLCVQKKEWRINHIWMASLLVQKHSSSYHCSSTSKHQFSITILKIYLKYRRFF